MEFRDFEIRGPLEILPRKIEDERGYFAETFRVSLFSDRVPHGQFVQDNQSLSVVPGTIRGLHFQSNPKSQGKLVRCTSGRLFDVAVDIRSDSPTYGQWVSVVLSPEKLNQLWVPVGFAHGFCTLEPNTVISYRVTNYYSPEHDLGVRWDDPDIAVEWPDIANPDTLSKRDGQQPSLADLRAHFTLEDN